MKIRLFTTIFAVAAAGIFAQLSVFTQEPLTDGRTVAAASGGRFTAQGWESVTNTDYLLYTLPEGAMTGQLTFEVKGLALNVGEGNARQNIIGLYNKFTTGQYYVKTGNGYAGFCWRFYYKALDEHPAGEIRFRLEGEGIYSRQQADTPPGRLNWDGNTWYTIEFSWSQTTAVWKKDGAVIATLSYPDKNQPFRYLYLSNAKLLDMAGRKDLAIRNVTIKTDVQPTAVETNKTGAAVLTIEAGPNPFNAAIKIAVSGQRIADSNIGISIYNVNGIMIDMLPATSYQLSAGKTWFPSNLPAGVYVLRLNMDGKSVSKKVIYNR